MEGPEEIIIPPVGTPTSTYEYFEMATQAFKTLKLNTSSQKYKEAGTCRNLNRLALSFRRFSFSL